MTARILRRFALALALVAAPTFAPRAADLEFLMSLFQLTQGVDGLSGAEEVVISADGLFAYVASEDHAWVAPQMGESGGVGVFDLNEGAGTIAFNSVVEVDGARALALSPGPTNGHLYVASATANQILWYTRHAGTGLLTLGGSVTGTPGLIQAWSVAVSNDGLHVYVAGLGDDTLAAFDRDLATGALTPAETFADAGTGMATPTEVRVTPDDTQVIVASQGDDTNMGVAFGRMPGDALVTPPDAIPSPLAGRGVSKSVAISPDNTSVYFGAQTAGAGSPSIAVFERDPMTNVLTANTIVDDPGLQTVVSLSVSPDGLSVVAAADVMDQLLTYDRAGNGSLTFFESIPDGGAIPLDGATSTAISPSGATIISVAKGGSDDGMTLFAPEPSVVGSALGALAALLVLSRTRSRRRNP